MNVPLTISYRDVPKSEAVEQLIREQAAKLERYCDYLSSCRVAVERPHQHERAGNPYRVRIDMTVPPSHELAVTTNPLDHDLHEDLSTMIIAAFKTARRRLERLVDKQHDEVKTHDEPTALVVRLFRDDGYGFIKTPDGLEVYFHRNSVAHDEFDSLSIGTEVRFEASEGVDGPQASTVQILNKPGARVADESGSKSPLGW